MRAQGAEPEKFKINISTPQMGAITGNAMSIPVAQALIRKLVPTISESLVNEHTGGLCGRLYFANLAKSFQDEKFQKSMAKVLCP